MSVPVAELLSVEVQCFGRYREVLPGGCVTIEVPVGATVAEFITCLHDGFPGALPLRPAVAVNRRLARDTETISAGDEIALIPAVAGG